MDFELVFNFVNKYGFSSTVAIISLVGLIYMIKQFVKTLGMLNKHTIATENLAKAVDDNFNPFSQQLNEGFMQLSNSINLFTQRNDLQFEQLTDMYKTSNYLSTDRSIQLFRTLAYNDCMQKIEYVGEILQNNNLVERKEEIRKNIETEFIRITNEGIDQLSTYKSVVGDLGQIVSDNLDWDEILSASYAIIFNDKSTEKQKISDLKNYIKMYDNRLERIIRDKGVHNE